MTSAGAGQQVKHPHSVQFYESDDFLTQKVASFLEESLADGGSAIVVATSPHLAAFHEGLRAAHIPTEACLSSGRLVLLDARETLGRFMVDGLPSRDLFNRSVGNLIAGLAKDNDRVHAYGEMVAVLWEEGNVAAAIELEHLWNELAESTPFSLLCAYPMRAFDRSETAEGFRQVCSAHTHLLPSESYSGLGSEEERAHAVVNLQREVSSSRTEADVLRAQQAELEAALDRVEELDRARNEVIQMVVHDIRTPTSIIANFLTLVTENFESLSEEQIKDFLGRGLQHTAHISKLVDDMLTAARIEGGEIDCRAEPFDLAEVVYGAIGSLRIANPERRFKVTVAPSLPDAVGDEQRQVQILNNLLSNAIKFSPADSTVHVDVVSLDGSLRVSVTDEGEGISAEEAPRLFKRFSRLERSVHSVKGTGLGLYISKALVEAQGGSIWLEAARPGGSSFSYTVPIAP